MSSHKRHATRRWAAVGACAISLVMVLGVVAPAGASSPAASRIVGRIKGTSWSNGVVIDRQGRFAYLMTSDYRLDVVDIAKRRVAFTVPLTGFALGVAVTPSGKSVYAGVSPNNFGLRDKYLTNVVNVAKRRTVSTIKGCIGVQMPAMAPDGKHVYLACPLMDSVFVVDTATNKITKEILTGVQPSVAVVSPDGQRVYVSNSESDSISVVDAKKGVEITTFPSGNTPGGLAISADGNRLYVACFGSSSVWVIDTTTGQALAKIRSEITRDVVLSRDGARLYSASTGVDVIDTTTNTALGNIPVKGDEVLGVAVLPDGKSVYAAVDSEYLYILNVAGFPNS
jgi:YVTN family beta-propeller protein